MQRSACDDSYDTDLAKMSVLGDRIRHDALGSLSQNLFCCHSFRNVRQEQKNGITLTAKHSHKMLMDEFHELDIEIPNDNVISGLYDAAWRPDVYIRRFEAN
jgi:hypothetical protein